MLPLIIANADPATTTAPLHNGKMISDDAALTVMPGLAVNALVISVVTGRDLTDAAFLYGVDCIAASDDQISEKIVGKIAATPSHVTDKTLAKLARCIWGYPMMSQSYRNTFKRRYCSCVK
ncbi:hypothetical protein HK17_11660 [Acetobacter indonesiensis]|uniref:Uncharacterized protein n=1 Tax=Acetobacter indonesiensis TaxID=104101 RepID=A0A252AP23_9PROT|nr:hypothetical protein HK17_11660 [Acetobacter indonesiensis]